MTSSSYRRRALALLLVAASAVVTAAASSSSTEVPAGEIARLNSHFDSVVEELRAADVSRLSRAQRGARETLILRLENYAAAGRFPHNHVVAGVYVPVFRDEHGTLCAMGHLIASTGRNDIVEDVVRDANLARIPMLARDPRLRAWLDSTGLTVAEAARIQPKYGPEGPCFCSPPPPVRVERRAKPAYYFGSAGAGVLSVAAALNARDARDSAAVDRAARLSVLAGAAEVVLGSFAVELRGPSGAVGITNMVVGAAAIGSGLWRVRSFRRQQEKSAASVSIVPHGAGLALSLRM